MLLGVLLTWWIMDTADGADNKIRGSKVRGCSENTRRLLKLILLTEKMDLLMMTHQITEQSLK